MFKIDIRSNMPIYEQLISQVKTAVIRGMLSKDDALPSVRKMAAALDVNPNTVAKAYQELERQGVIITIRGKGTIINEIPTDSNADIGGITEKMKPLITELIYLGKTKAEILSEIEKICNEMGL